MTENQFDEFFRKKLEDYSSQVPENMWQRIKQKKDKDRKVIILLVLLLLMVGIATSYFIFGVNKNPVTENIASSKKHANNKNDNRLNQNNKNETINIQNDTTTLKEENKNSLSNKEITIRNTQDLNKVNYPTHKNNKSELNNLPAKKNSENNNDSPKNNLNAIKSYQQNLSKNPGDSSGNNFLNEITISSNEEIVKKDDQKRSLLQKDSSLKKEQNGTDKPPKNNESSITKNLFLEVYLSPDIPLSKTSSTNAAYLQHKDSTSKMQLSYTVGLKLSALFGNHISGKIGFQYSQINEKFNYTNKNATRIVPVVIQRSLADAYGTIRTVDDTSNLIQSGTQYKLTYNHYKSIDIPVLIGYEIGGDRFKAAFSTGIILNIKTSYSGDILDTSLSPVDINSNDVYKSNTGMSLYFGLSLATKLNNNFQLFTEPYIRYRLSNMAGTYQPFTQKINVGGLSFGLKYNFKK